MHPVGQLTPADPTVGLQDADDSSVDSVKYRRFDGHVSSLPEKQPVSYTHLTLPTSDLV